MMPEGQKMVCVTDSNWDAYCEYQAYDHQAMDRSNDYMLEKVRKDMANYKTGPDGFHRAGLCPLRQRPHHPVCCRHAGRAGRHHGL